MNALYDLTASNYIATVPFRVASCQYAPRRAINPHGAFANVHEHTLVKGLNANMKSLGAYRDLISILMNVRQPCLIKTLVLTGPPLPIGRPPNPPVDAQH